MLNFSEHGDFFAMILFRWQFYASLCDIHIACCGYFCCIISYSKRDGGPVHCRTRVLWRTVKNADTADNYAVKPNRINKILVPSLLCMHRGVLFCQNWR